MIKWKVVRINPETKERIPFPCAYNDKNYAEKFIKEFNGCWKHPKTGLVFKLEIEKCEV